MERVVANYHENYLKEIGMADSVEAYIQLVVLKKTLQSISHDNRHGEEINGALAAVPNLRTRLEPVMCPALPGNATSI